MRQSIAAFAAASCLVLGGGLRGVNAAEERGLQGGALVIVTKATSACFSDMVRVTGFLVPHREAQVVVDQEGFRVNDVLVTEGAKVTDGQEVVRLQPPPGAAAAGGGQPGAAAPGGGVNLAPRMHGLD